MDEYDDDYQDHEYDYDAGMDNFEEEREEGDLDEYKEPDVEYGAERNAYERVFAGRPGEIVSKLFPEGFSSKESRKLENIHKKIFRLTITDEEKFKLMVSIFFNKLNQEMKLGESDLDNLLSIDKIPNIKYKNPIAYIIGYFVVKNKEINKKKLEFAISDLLPQVDDVTKEDIIRYSRFWINL